MTTSDKLREIVRIRFLELFERNPSREEAKWIKNIASDLTALISEKQAEYFEFVKWIGFYSTTLYYRDIDEKWLRTRFDIDGIPTEEYDEYTTEELFEYWKTNEK